MNFSNSTILFQGDSITDCGRNRDEAAIANSMPALGGGYPHLCATRLRTDYADQDLQIFNRGISGNRVVDLFGRWKEDCLNLKPGLISILIGVNDTWHEFARQTGVSVAKYERVYRDILRETREVLPETKLVLCEPFVLLHGAVASEWLPEIKQRRKIVRQLASEFEAIFVPLQDAFDKAAQNTGPEYWLKDGVHPTPAGHQLITDQWLKAVC
jgi:lysophospholipase L1-like esterase